MTDRLICLGDLCDRRDGVKQVIEELMKVRQLIFIRGNHDQWALEWMQSPGEGYAKMDQWLAQGGDNTVRSYWDGVPHEHIEFMQQSVFYYQEEDRLFVHGGIDPDRPLERQDRENFLWDRNLVGRALKHDGEQKQLTPFDEVFVGHTPTLNFDRLAVNNLPDRTYPMKFCNVWLMG